MPVVTIAGETGSGVPELGQGVARLIGGELLDREIIAQAAERLRVKEEEVAKWDMRPESLRQRLARTLDSIVAKAGAAGDPMMGSSGPGDLLSRTYQEALTDASEVTDRHYVEAVCSVIRNLAEDKNIVILHRGGQFVLRDSPNAFHVYVVGFYEDRLRRLMAREGLHRQKALNLMEELERNRTAYFRKFFKADVRDPSHYHLVVNTTKVPIEEAVKIVANAALSGIEKDG